MRALKTTGADGVPQVVYYDRGVGTGDALDKYLGGLFGWGLSRAVMAAYGWLANNYARGDRIYLTGFSRGAYTARSVAGPDRRHRHHEQARAGRAAVGLHLLSHAAECPLFPPLSRQCGGASRAADRVRRRVRHGGRPGRPDHALQPLQQALCIPRRDLGRDHPQRLPGPGHRRVPQALHAGDLGGCRMAGRATWNRRGSSARTRTSVVATRIPVCRTRRSCG